MIIVGIEEFAKVKGVHCSIWSQGMMEQEKLVEVPVEIFSSNEELPQSGGGKSKFLLPEVFKLKTTVINDVGASQTESLRNRSTGLVKGYTF